MIKQSQATAVWNGDLKGGKGMINSQHGAVREVPYNFAKRFEGETGATPEELIAAAHAACFSMALSAELAKSRITAESISTTATVTLDMVNNMPTVSEIHLTTEISAPGADEQTVAGHANDAKAGCPISRLLNAKITLDVNVV